MKISFILIILLLGDFAQANIWQFNDLQIKNKNNILEFSATAMKTPFTIAEITNIQYQCQAATQVYPLHKCNNGNIQFNYLGNDYIYLLNGWFNFANKSWDLNISNDASSIKLNTNSTNRDKLTIDINNMPVIELQGLLGEHLQITSENITALISATIDVDIAKHMILTADYEINGLTWESKNSEYFFADSRLQGKIKVVKVKNGLNIIAQTEINQGEGLFKDIYVLFGQQPVIINTHINLDNNFQATKTQFDLRATKDVQIKLDIIDWQNNQFNINYNIANLDILYQGFLASYLEIIGIDKLNVSGVSQGKIQFGKGIITTMQASLKNINLEIESKKTEFDNLSADLNWQAQGQLQTSNFSWNHLLLAGMPIKQSTLELTAVGQQLYLQKDTTIPIFDGSVLINKLNLNNIFAKQIAIDFIGEVKPISIALITKKLGWAIMDGTISGKIPGMQKHGQSITFDGSLELQVFSGSMQVNNLSMERLFGIAPVIAADINFEKLNLQQITSTFDFGKITGLINGEVNGLRITNWKADRLDAYVQSTKTKGVKQTISQRAIDNISSIGGIQGAISRSFLRFFDSFKYKKIAISCTLRNSICAMGGIKSPNSKNTKNTNNTYTLIQGKGIPSINIIGFRKYIDWEVFIDRLLNAGY